jgi:type IV fimbrial biogenesis protein FimT
VIELVVALGILALLLAVTGPTFSRWQANAEVKRQARDLFSNVQRAKFEAAKRNRRVVVAFSPEAYSPAGKRGSYEVFVDEDTDSVRDAGEQLIVEQSMPSGVSLYTADFDDFAGLGTPAAATGFRPRGLPLSCADGAANEGVKLRNNKSRYYRILLSSTGNITLEMSDDGTW